MDHVMIGTKINQKLLCRCLKNAIVYIYIYICLQQLVPCTLPVASVQNGIMHACSHTSSVGDYLQVETIASDYENGSRCFDCNLRANKKEIF